VAVFAIELLSVLLYGQEVQEDLFHFTIDVFRHLDESPLSHISNLPVFFLINACRMMGYQINGKYEASATPVLHLESGNFTAAYLSGSITVNTKIAALVSELNQLRDVEKAAGVKTTNTERREILNALMTFLKLHLPYYKELKSLP